LSTVKGGSKNREKKKKTVLKGPIRKRRVKTPGKKPARLSINRNRNIQVRKVLKKKLGILLQLEPTSVGSKTGERKLGFNPRKKAQKNGNSF